MARLKWTPERLELLRHMYIAKKTWTEIARACECTETAARQQLKRLRDVPRRRSGRPLGWAPGPAISHSPQDVTAAEAWSQGDRRFVRALISLGGHTRLVLKPRQRIAA